MTRPPRVVFFTDSYHEANGIARISREMEAYAVRRDLPFVCIHGGAMTSVSAPGPRRRVELRRGVAAFRLDHDLEFDPLLWRHASTVRAVLRAFQPDVLHVTGPSDVGLLGAYLGHRLSIPIVGSWHTNLHQYAALRSLRWLQWLPVSARLAARDWVDRQVLRAALLFYRIPRLLLAPNQDLVDLLSGRTKKPTFLMRHGVDTATFAPSKRTRDRSAGPVHIGFVGRLAAEKHVRLLATLERALEEAGLSCRFVVAGDGAEREWLQRHLKTVHCCGVLTGEALSRAYADMDLFVFPSTSDTFGLVVLEAMASGVPVVAMSLGGPKFVVKAGTTGLLARDDDEFVGATVRLVRNRDLREQFGRAARAQACDWSWDAVFDGLYQVYGEAPQWTRAAPSPVPA